MTSPGRVYVVAGTLLVFFVLWASIAASPWRSTKPDAARRRPRTTRGDDPRRQAADGPARLHGALDAYRATLAQRRATAGNGRRRAPVPQVRIVQLPPVATTRTS